MKDKELLNEYVLEEMGKIWVGPHTSTRGRSWSFGQFDDSVLPLIMILLEKSGLALQQRGNPILVSRALSKMVKSCVVQLCVGQFIINIMLLLIADMLKEICT